MVNTYLKLIVLYCLHKIDGQRSMYSIFHLLKGKKSAQTIQDAHFFRLTNLFYLYPYLLRDEIEQIVENLKENGLISQVSTQSFRLTKLGEKALQEQLNKQPIPSSLDGWRFQQISDLFWERLSLTIQVVSHLKNREAKYLPIQRKREVHVWVKGFLQQTALNRNELSRELYKELVQCLEGNNEIDPSVLVLRLTGYNKVGLTPLQAAENLELDLDVYLIQFKSLIHYMLNTIYAKQKEYPLLSKFVSQAQHSFSLTQSAGRTYSLLKKGFKVEEIVAARRLKKSTIEDHIVEIALNIKQFDISTFVDIEKQNLIVAAVKKSSSRQLKHIRQLVPQADYFEIRLTLAIWGDDNDN